MGGTDSAGGSGGSANSGSGGTTGTGGGSSTGGTGGGSSASFDCNPAEGEVPELGLETIASNLDEPVYVVAPPGDSERLFVVQQGGEVLVVQGGTATTCLDL